MVYHEIGKHPIKISKVCRSKYYKITIWVWQIVLFNINVLPTVWFVLVDKLHCMK